SLNNIKATGINLGLYVYKRKRSLPYPMVQNIVKEDTHSTEI
ncbi:2585_t:CDS:1, partial [Racocetra persica]